MSFADPNADRERFVYHYTDIETAAKILETRTIQLGSYAKLKDPWESRLEQLVPRAFTVTGPVQDPAQRGQANDLRDTALYFLNRIRPFMGQLRCFCTTEDLGRDDLQRQLEEGQRERATPIGHLGRGYASSAMWLHYGENHGGACLVFDRQKLDGRVEASSECSSFVHARRITYETRIQTRAASLDMAEAKPGNRDATFCRWVSSSKRLLFVKARDWKYEREYRWIVLRPPGSETTPTVDYNESLVGVVLGSQVERVWMKMLGALLPSRVAKFHQLKWLRGNPGLDEI